jgi:8-oxo-dGTP pyrophosphatase MutT (NUDIX family)
MASPKDSFATPRVAAGAIFVNEDGEVLLVHPTYKDSWDIPGGYVERGESPAAACERELREELGIHRSVKALIAVDWAPSDNEGDKLLFLFDCGELSKDDQSNIRVDGDEIDRWEWVAEGSLDRYLIARLGRRIASVLDEAQRLGLYLEHGLVSPVRPSRVVNARNG